MENEQSSTKRERKKGRLATVVLCILLCSVFAEELIVVRNYTVRAALGVSASVLDVFNADKSNSSTRVSKNTYTTKITGISREFKEAMDKYEAFFDEYIDFMVRYEKSDGGFLMLASYASMWARYTQTVLALDSIDENKLSNADLAYYTEVMTRIYKKIPVL